MKDDFKDLIDTYALSLDETYDCMPVVFPNTDIEHPYIQCLEEWIHVYSKGGSDESFLEWMDRCLINIPLPTTKAQILEYIQSKYRSGFISAEQALAESDWVKAQSKEAVKRVFG